MAPNQGVFKANSKVIEDFEITVNFLIEKYFSVSSKIFFSVALTKTFALYLQQCAFTSCTLDIGADQALLLVAPGMMSKQKFENSENYGALEERDGEPGGNSGWIGSL